MNFYEAIKSCLSKYNIFTGRAVRSEYWYWRLFELILALISFKLDEFFFSEQEFGSISLFVFFFTFIPGVAVSVRRLHDIGRTGWWLLISLTGIGNFVLLYWFILPSRKKENIFK